MTRNFADLLTKRMMGKNCRCVVGLDPRLELIPDVFKEGGSVEDVIVFFNQTVLGTVSGIVPAVKLQIAFYEQYGLAGMAAFSKTLAAARALDLVVIADVKRNDIDSTARAYARAYLGGAGSSGTRGDFEVDAITISPFLGVDSLMPFVEAAEENGKGLFILVRTSNTGAAEIQELRLEGGDCLYEYLARIVNKLGVRSVGECGYSAIGAVVGATAPAVAGSIRRVMPRAMVLVPGYGAQGGTAESAAESFGPDGLGAIVNSSRTILYGEGVSSVGTTGEYSSIVRERVLRMRDELNRAISERRG